MERTLVATLNFNKSACLKREVKDGTAAPTVGCCLPQGPGTVLGTLAQKTFYLTANLLSICGLLF